MRKMKKPIHLLMLPLKVLLRQQMVKLMKVLAKQHNSQSR
jgi:hypothetical protein